jgi:glycosyltransferase involved in cell wall biosynthesis
VQKQLASQDLCSLANGGNADLGDLNWVHYVHAAFEPPACRPGQPAACRAEPQALRRRRATGALTRAARDLQQQPTADDVVKLVGVARDRMRVVYCGLIPTSSAVSMPPSAPPSGACSVCRPRGLALFVGALGDRRKGFDTVFTRGARPAAARGGTSIPLVASTGLELEAWKARAARELPEGRIRFLGFRRDMPAVFAACDLLIHPARYEAYGLAVHEAICRGLPALVSATAGVAERTSADLDQLLLQDPASATELAGAWAAWRGDDGVAERVAEFAARLRARTRDHMAREIVELREKA